jgi:sugar/nucleoside kinase (ribokinase family)
MSHVTIVGVDGGLSVDHLVRVGEAPHFFELGGPGLFAALGARLIEGTKVMLRTALPSSVPEFSEVLTAADVDLSLCGVAREVPRVWILDSPEGRRLVLTGPPAGLEIAEADEVPAGRSTSKAKGFPRLDALLLCSPLRLPADVKYAAILGIDPEQRKTSANSLSYWKRITIPQKSVLIPSRLQLVSVDNDPFRAALHLCEMLEVPVIAKLDADGALAVDASGAWHVTDEEVQVVDTTGAGDAMAGAALAAIASGCDIATAAALGVSAARLALSDWGAGGLINSRSLSRPLRGVRTRRR